MVYMVLLQIMQGRAIPLRMHATGVVAHQVAHIEVGWRWRRIWNRSVAGDRRDPCGGHGNGVGTVAAVQFKEVGKGPLLLHARKLEHLLQS